MTNEMMKQESHELDDGFAGYVDEIENEEGLSTASSRVIQGTKLQFTNEALWIDLVQKWGKDPSKPPIERSCSSREKNIPTLRR